MQFHLQTSYLVPDKVHLMTQVQMIQTEGQGQIFPKCYLTYRLHTWYQGTTE